MRILVVEDNEDIQDLLKEVLNKAGYEVLQAFTGSEGKLISTYERIDLILLDLMIPGITGEDLLRDLRSRNMTVPVIIMSAKPGASTRIETLRSGADDFVQKPFDIEELLARIEANLRRTQKFFEGVESEIVFKNLKYRYSDNVVFVNGEELRLTKKEQEILVLLLENQKKIFSKENLYRSIWQEDYAYDDNTINVHMSNLRNKIQKLDPDNEYLETIWGMGYRLKK